MQDNRPVHPPAPMLRIPQLTAQQLAERRERQASPVSRQSQPARVQRQEFPWIPRTSPLPEEPYWGAPPFLTPRASLYISQAEFGRQRPASPFQEPRVNQLFLNCTLLVIMALLTILILYFLSTSP